MPDFSTLVLFAAACLALTATPGPDMLLIVSRSVSQGRASGFATLAGIQVGTYCHALAAALGLSQLFLVVPLAYDVVRYVGAAYLLYLAWQAFRSAGTALAPTAGLRRYPIGSVSVAVQIMLLATVLNLVGLLVNGAVILTASRLGRAFSARSRWRRAPQLLLGTVVAGLAVRLALDGRR